MTEVTHRETLFWFPLAQTDQLVGRRCGCCWDCAADLLLNRWIEDAVLTGPPLDMVLISKRVTSSGSKVRLLTRHPLAGIHG